MRFETTWALALLGVVAMLPPLRAWAARARIGVGFPSVAVPSGIRQSLRHRLEWLPAALKLLALALLVVALARPREGLEQVVDVSRGIAIEIVVDRSGSMVAPIGDRGPTRLDAVKQVVARFVHGDEAGLDGRPNDLVGLVTFARYPETVLPLTLSHRTLDRFLSGVEVVTERSEDGTAIGDALALAAARLRVAEEALGSRDDYEIKSKVIILLTDGSHNAGARTPAQAGELAAGWGIKVYAIGIGVGAPEQTVRTPLGTFRLPAGQPVDAAALQALAERTGGLFRMADDAESLAAIYREIDRLETSEVESVRYVDFRERFAPWALGALGAAAAAAALTATVFRRTP